MGKTFVHDVVVRDQNGVIQPGETVIAYPYGTLANPTNAANPGDGTYRFTFDYVADGNGVISRFYDIYRGAVLELTKVPWGDAWLWLVNLTVNITPKLVLFNALVDENGDALPAAILNAKIQIMYPENDMTFFISALNDNGFTIEASVVGGVSLPVDVNLKIFTGEA